VHDHQVETHVAHQLPRLVFQLRQLRLRLVFNLFHAILQLGDTGL